MAAIPRVFRIRGVWHNAAVLRRLHQLTEQENGSLASKKSSAFDSEHVKAISI
jgi:hypothetical protein